MDPQSKSLLTSLVLGVAGIATGYLASHNIIPAADVTTDTAIVGSFLTLAGGAAIAWYKTHQVSQPAMIQAVNKADNGVKVVPDDARSAPIAAVNAPVK